MSGGIGPVAGTTPYPWPWDGGCGGSRLALVVAGWDAGWCSRVDPAHAAAAERSVQALAVAVVGAGGLVLTIGHSPAARLCRPRAFRHPAAVAGASRLIDAAGIDGFHGSGLDATLRSAGATHLLLAGHGLEAPVHSTMRSGNDQGYECLLVLDACSPLQPDLLPAARSMVEMSGGIFGAVGATADVLAALVPVAAVHCAPAAATAAAATAAATATATASASPSPRSTP